MLLSSIYPLGVYFQGVEGTALTRGRTWSPRSGTPPGSVMNASSMSTSATCIASTAPTPGAGGQVRISVHRQGASTTLIHVADDGEGIPPGQLGHIFERFYRGGAARNRDNDGAGIGLIISKALSEAHSGTLTITSSGPGRGAVFTLRLPLSPPDSEEAAR